ncbi:polysaccharide biosynthesis/export family protein [Pseudomonas sp.]|uniref:polysaccharide biosynthesis/export family protein n=1 Tax=Pseudomonas sp. TaxID=306 RepID=UPI0028AB1463|nr:polysaccharide biosynthesis/export family protein [Pseudomonas sp.]
MRIPTICKSVIMLLLLAFSAVASAAQYQLGSGDVIRISVHGEPDLSFEEIRLTDAGTFTFPFIGEVDANGKTAGQVRNLLVEKLKDGYLIDPRISVSVVTYREFYISGEVKSPGGYPYQPGLTLDRAIALAGGLTERASTKRMTIVRGSQGSRAEEEANMNTLVRPGDTINIDEGFF